MNLLPIHPKPYLLLLLFVVITPLYASNGIDYPTPSQTQFQSFLGQGSNKADYHHFIQFLKQQGVDKVIPPDQLLRQGTDWATLKQPPFAMPPKKMWPNIIKTLRFLRQKVIPVIGDLEVLSGFRSKQYNRVAGGAKRSQHLVFSAIDVIPLSIIDRHILHRQLKRIWRKEGQSNSFGLGLYSKIRFHIDTARFRTW